MICKKCVMTDKRPGITFNEEGICMACQMFEYKKKVDWSKRWLELDELCSKYRNRLGEYDCIITVSGGKDSHYQVGLFKEMFNMNPLCIMIDNTSWTKTGRRNLENLSERFDVDVLIFSPSRKVSKEATKKDFINELWPNKLWDQILYRKPLELAQKLGIKLVIWGENTSLTIGGSRSEESPDAKRLIPDPEVFEDLEVIFTSYYVPWSRFYNAEYAIKNGFQTLENEWKREGLEGFEWEQIDTIGYSVNQYCKFIKFGFGGLTELLSDSVRQGKTTREEAIKRVNEDDWKCDSKMINDFNQFIHITPETFWDIIDKHVNKELLEKRKGWWRLKENAT